MLKQLTCLFTIKNRKTIDFIETVVGPSPQDRQIDFLTIHPRTRSTPSSIPINLEALELLTNKYGDRVPILVSGDIFSLGSLPYTSHLTPPTFTSSSSSSSSSLPAATKGKEEQNNDRGKQQEVLDKMPHLPKLRGLMSARALLANPALFAGYETCPWEAVELFMNNVARAPLPFQLVLHHCMSSPAPFSMPTFHSVSPASSISQNCFKASKIAIHLTSLFTAPFFF